MLEKDLKVLQDMDDQTLTEWWCLLNNWGWPDELPDPETKEFRWKNCDSSRAWEIMG